MGLMDKIWDEVFTAQQQQPKTAAPPDSQNAPRTSKQPPAIIVPESVLLRSGSLSSPPQSPTSPTEEIDRRSSSDFGEGGSVRGPRAASQKIRVTNAPPRRVSLDSAQSLPTGFRFMPDILSPGSTRREENVWRSVFNPGSNRAMEGLGSSKFDKADPKGPSVYDWFNRPTSRSQYR